jgi:hypothetical protein
LSVATGVHSIKVARLSCNVYHYMKGSAHYKTGMVEALAWCCVAHNLECLQAYGARNYQLLGVVLQTAILVVLTACIPIALLWIKVHPSTAAAM